MRGWAGGCQLQTVRYQNVMKCYTASRYAIKIDLNFVEWKGLAWIHLARSMDSWQVFLNTVMKFRFL